MPNTLRLKTHYMHLNDTFSSFLLVDVHINNHDYET